MTEQRERAATEALAFLFRSSPAARDAIGRMLAPGADLAINTAVAEHMAGDESRPDIALFGPAGATVAFVEGKFWASLTDAQPVDYLKRLAEAGGTHLLFVVPERRVVSIGYDIIARLGSTAVSGSRPNWLRVGSAEVGVVSWTSVIDAIEGEASSSGDSATVSDARQLRGLCEAMEFSAFAPLSRAEVENADTARLIVQLSDLARDAVEAAEADNVLAIGRLRPTHGYYSAGRYAKFKNAGFWVGLQHIHWRERGRTPFWVVFHPGNFGRAEELARGLSAWLNDTPPRAYVYREESLLIVPLMVPVGVERGRAVRALVGELDDLRRAVEALPLPALDSGTGAPSASDL